MLQAIKAIRGSISYVRNISISIFLFGLLALALALFAQDKVSFAYHMLQISALGGLTFIIVESFDKFNELIIRVLEDKNSYEFPSIPRKSSPSFSSRVPSSIC